MNYSKELKDALLRRPYETGVTKPEDIASRPQCGQLSVHILFKKVYLHFRCIYAFLYHH